MTGRPWFYDDVVFDDGRAEAALVALRRAKAKLIAFGDARAGAGPKAREDWSGRFGDDFDDRLADTQRGLVAALERVEAAIRLVSRAADDAAEDRVVRARLVARHEAELADQRRRQAAQAAAPVGGVG